MHESQAKAFFLRDLRSASASVADFYKHEHVFDSKKSVQSFLSAFRKAHQMVTLFEYKKPTRHPWHFHSTFFYLEPKAFDEDGIGKLMVAQRTTLDSKKLIKNDLAELMQVDVAQDALFHSHFFIRLIQRAQLDGLHTALQLVAHSLAVVLVHSKYTQQHFEQGQKVHIVFEDKVFIVNCETEQGIMIFKTVLLCKFMTPKQLKFYQDAITQAKASNNGFETFLELDDTLELIG